MKIKSIVIHERAKKENSTGAVTYIEVGAGGRMASLKVSDPFVVFFP